MARRRPGIYERNGWYHARWPFTGSLKTRVYADAVAEYDRRLQVWKEKKREVRKPDTELRKCETVKDYLDVFVEKIISNRRRPRPARDAALRLRRATTAIREMAPADLRMNHIEAVRAFLDRTKVKGDRRLKPQSVHDHLRDLKWFLRWCAREIPIRCLPFDSVIMPKLAQAESKEIPPEVLARFFKVAGEPYASVSRFLLFTGLRWSEYTGLEWTRHVRLTGRPRLVFLSPKTQREQPVYLGKEAVEILFRWRQQTGGARYVGPWRPRNPNTVYARLGREIGYHIHPHLFRHTFANLYCDRNGNIEALQFHLRHASVRTTQRYRRPGEQFARADFEKTFEELTLDNVTKNVTNPDDSISESREA